MDELPLPADGYLALHAVARHFRSVLVKVWVGGGGDTKGRTRDRRGVREGGPASNCQALRVALAKVLPCAREGR